MNVSISVDVVSRYQYNRNMGHSASKQPSHSALGNFTAFSVLRYREYRLFWLGAVFSNLGVWALSSGRLWLMHELTKSPFMLGLLTISGTGPVLVLSMWGGVIADRVNRLRLITLTRALFSAQAILTGLLISFNIILPWHLIAISLATGILFSFDIPTRQAILPNLVKRDDLMNAIVVYSFIFGASAVIGPAYFAPLVNLLGTEGLFFFVGTSYVGTVAMLLMMKPLHRKNIPSNRKLLEDLLAGISYIRLHRAVFSLIVLGLTAGVFGMSFGTLLPVFANEILHGGAGSYSLLLMGGGIGGLIGTVFLALFGNLKNSASLQLATGIGFGLGLAVFSRITWLPASVTALVFVSACSSSFGTVNNTLLQAIVAEEYRGRVMSIHQMSSGASAVGGLIIGTLAQAVGAPFSLALSGLVTAIATATFTLWMMRDGHVQLSTGQPLGSDKPENVHKN